MSAVFIDGLCFFCWLLRPLCLPSNNLNGPLANKELFINGLSFFLGPLTNKNLTINGLFNFYGPLTNKQLSIDGPLTNKELNIYGPLTNNILNIDGPLTNKPYLFEYEILVLRELLQDE